MDLDKHLHFSSLDFQIKTKRKKFLKNFEIFLAIKRRKLFCDAIFKQHFLRFLKAPVVRTVLKAKMLLKEIL